jgi:hypothetical protein
VRTVAQEPFEPGTVTGRDVEGGIDAEPTGSLPSEHVIGDVALKQTVAVEVPEHTVSNGLLKFVPVGGREMGGLVEMEVRVQGRSEAMNDRDGPDLGTGTGSRARISERGPNGA